MRYKVIDVTTNKCISSANNTSIILKPNGRAAYNDYGDEIGIPDCVILFYPRENNDQFYIDEVGGIHEDGCGWSPMSQPCGECSTLSCSLCEAWRRDNRNPANHKE